MLYQYCVCNKFFFENLCKSQLYFNTITRFNDVFDNFPVYRLRGEAIEAADRQLLASMPGSSLTPSEYVERMWRLSHVGGLYEKRRGVTCFAASDDNQLMWAHYGDASRGVCLGFDFPQVADVRLSSEVFPQENSVEAYFLPIEYDNKRPKFTVKKDENGNSMVMDLLRRKSTLWAYEKESRILLVDEKENFPRAVVYQPNLLRSITFGYRTKLETVLQLILFFYKRNRQNSCNMRYITLAPESYAMYARSLSWEHARIMIDNIKWIEKRLWLPQPITASEDFVHALSEDEYLQVLHNLPAHVVWDLSDMFFRSDFPRFMQNGGRGEEFLKVALVRNVLADMMRAVNLDQKVKQ